MPLLTFSPVSDEDEWDLVKGHFHGVKLQKRDLPTLEYRVIFGGYSFIHDYILSDCDSVYSLIARAITQARNKNAEAANSHITPQDKAQLLEKLKLYVQVYNESQATRLISDQKFEEAKKFLEKNPSYYRFADVNGDTPLHIACREDRLEFVRYLIASAARRGGFFFDDGGEAIFDPNARNHARWTPLHCASYGFHFKICDVLLKETPIAVNCITEPGRSSPLHFLAKYRDPTNGSDFSSSAFPTSLNDSLPPNSTVTPATPSRITISSVSQSSQLNNADVQLLSEVLNTLHEFGADVSARDSKGETPLHVAASSGSIVVAQWLIVNRADLNAVSCSQETPLHLAVQGNHAVIVEMLLIAGADVNIQSSAGTPLDMAKKSNSVDLVKLLSDHSRLFSTKAEESAKVSFSLSGNDLIPVKSEDYIDSLPPSSTKSIRSKSTSSPSSSTFDNNIRANSISISASNAQTNGSPGMIVVQAHSKLQPVDSPASSTSPSSTNLQFTATTSTPSSLSSSDSVGDYSAFSTLTNSIPSLIALPFISIKQLRKAAENLLFSPGRTPVHDAVIQNRRSMVKYLLHLNPSMINVKDQIRWTPALYAAAHGHVEILQDLVNLGADLSCVDLDESGILHFLARARRATSRPYEFHDLIHSLVENSVNIDATNVFGATCLHEAAARNNLILLQTLCEYGANIESVTKTGETPIIYAARQNNVDAVNFLLHKGANMDHVSKYGSAVTVARSFCHLSVLKVFLFYKSQNITGKIPSMKQSKLSNRSRAVSVADSTNNSTNASDPKLPAPSTQNTSKHSSPNDARPLLASSGSVPVPTTSAPSSIGETEIITIEDVVSEQDALSNSGSDIYGSRSSFSRSPNKIEVDYNFIHQIDEPLLAVYSCSLTISSPTAAFKDTDGVILVWQRFIGFSHVSTNSAGVQIPDSSYNWKLSFKDIFQVNLSKSMFGTAKLVIAACQKTCTASEIAESPGEIDLSPKVNTNISIANSIRLEPLDRLLKYLWEHSHSTERLDIDGYPLPDMVGAILFPKENAECHSLFPDIPISETVLESFLANLKEEGTFASKLVYVTQHRLCFGKKNWTQILYQDIKTLRKTDSKTIVVETSSHRFTFTGIVYRDSMFSKIEGLWNAQQSDNRIVLFSALGRRSMQLCELYIEKLVKSKPANLYIRWVLIQGYHVLEKRQQDSLRDHGIDVIWISPKALSSNALHEIVQFMRQIVFVYLEFDARFLEIAEMLIPIVGANKLKQILLVSLALGDQGSYLCESIALLQEKIRSNYVDFVFLNSNPAFMQILEDEFVDIKRDWRFRLPWTAQDPVIAWVDLRDVVAVTAHITVSGDFENQKNKFYYISGPDSLTSEEVATIITQATEQEVRFIPSTSNDMKAILQHSLRDSLNSTSASSYLSAPRSQSPSKTLSMNQYLPAIASHTIADVIQICQSSSSTILNSLAPKLSFEERDLPFDTEQYLCIFQDLSKFDVHSITSSLTLDLTHGRPRTLRSFVSDHLESFKATGLYYFTNAQSEASQRYFNEYSIIMALPTPQKIETTLFAKIFSPLITANSPFIAQRLVRLYDLDCKGYVTAADFVRTSSILVNGEPKEQLLLACDFFDGDSDRNVTAEDISSVGAEIVNLLSAVGIDYHGFSIRKLLSPKGLEGYPREPYLTLSPTNGPGVSLASTQKPLRQQLNVSEFCYVLKLNRTSLWSIGTLQGTIEDAMRASKKRPGQFIFPGHPLWEQSLRISIGISQCMQFQMTQGAASIPDQVTPAHCDKEKEFRISGYAESEPWLFYEYGSTAFRKIREMSGISCPSYLASLGIEVVLGNFLLGNLAVFEEISSSGRSGSFFLRSHNSKFLVKSLPLDEFTFLRKSLWRYYKYLMENPKTLLTRFFGLYRMKSGNKELFFVIMANLFDNTLEVHEQYDLKGSTVNRYLGDKMQYWSPSIAMKDLDFHRVLQIGSEAKAAMLQQAESDAIFMETFNICDYSLLVGIHYSDTVVSELASVHLTTGEFGCIAGVPDANGDLEYYLCGLIDILTQFSLKKRSESALKSIVHRKSQISAISPSPYRRRFVKYLSSILD